MQNEQDIQFMNEALKEAQLATSRGDFGVGAVLVYDDKILARASNQMLSSGLHVWAHPETMVLREIENTHNDTSNLYKGMTLYTTLAPCPQCWGAILVRGIGRLVIGATDELSATSYQDVPIAFKNNVPKIVNCTGKIAEDCLRIFSETREVLDKKIGWNQ